MRRSLVLTLVAGLVAGLAPHSNAATYSMRRMKLADAVWLLPTGEPHVYRGYVAYAMLFVDPFTGDTQSYAFAMKGRCTLTKKRGATVVACVASGTNYGSYSPRDKDFEIDPVLRSARLRLRDKRFPRQSVYFGGDGVTSVGYGEEWGKSGDGASDHGYFLAERAHAIGRLFGDTVRTTRKRDSAWYGYGPNVQQHRTLTVRHGRAVLRMRLSR